MFNSTVKVNFLLDMNFFSGDLTINPYSLFRAELACEASEGKLLATGPHHPVSVPS